MDIGRLRNRYLMLHMAVDTQEAGLLGFWLYFLSVCFILGAGAGFLGAEVVVGGLDMYIRCSTVRLC